MAHSAKDWMSSQQAAPPSDPDEILENLAKFLRLWIERKFLADVPNGGKKVPPVYFNYSNRLLCATIWQVGCAVSRYAITSRSVFIAGVARNMPSRFVLSKISCENKMAVQVRKIIASH
jgi:hypothetical protein